jgi:hypothetical protein
MQNDIIKYLLVTWFLLYLSLLEGCSVNDKNYNIEHYKSLHEKIRSKHYQLTKLENLVGGFFYWHKKKKKIVVSFDSDEKVNLGPIEEYIGVEYVRRLLKIGDFENKYPKRKDLEIIDLAKLFNDRKMSENEMYNFLTKAYSESVAFGKYSSYSGYECLFKINDKKWYYSGNLGHFDKKTYKFIYAKNYSSENSPIRKILQKFIDDFKEKNIEVIQLDTDRDIQYGWDYNWKDKNNVIKLDRFIKEGKSSDIGLFYGFLSFAYEGEGLYSLQFKGEELKFKMYTMKYRFSFNSYWGYVYFHSAPGNIKNDIAILEVDDPNDSSNSKANGYYLIHPIEE